MSTEPFRPRHPAGTPAGGKFAPSGHAEGALDEGLTSGHDAEHPRSSIEMGHEERPYDEIAGDLDEIAAATSAEELDRWVADPDPDLRCEVAASPFLDLSQAQHLADDPDFVVRWQIARTQIPGLAHHMSNDQDPVIRHECLGAWDLPEADRHRLLNDADVQRVRRALTAA